MDWNTTHSRRRFMAFGIAGAVPIVAGGRRLLAQAPAIGSVRTGRDPVMDQIASELARIQRSTKAGGIRGEHVHEFAGQVRVLLAHGQATDLDSRVRSGMGAVVETKGRDAIVDSPDGNARLANRLKALGLDPADAPSRPPLSHDKRADLLDSLLVGGVTPRFERLDANLARAESKADKFGARQVTGPRPLIVQDCWDAWSMLSDEMWAAAEICEWFAPELSGIFAVSAMLCEGCMYVACWGG